MSFDNQDSFLYKREDVNFTNSIGELDKLWLNKVKYEVLALNFNNKISSFPDNLIAKRINMSAITYKIRVGLGFNVFLY